LGSGLHGAGTPLEAKEKAGRRVSLILPGWFKDTLDDLITMAGTAGTDWMLLGAVPVSHYGWSRATTDLDFAIATDASASDFVDGWMTSRGYAKKFGPSEIQGKGIWLSKYWKDLDDETNGMGEQTWTRNRSARNHGNIRISRGLDGALAGRHRRRILRRNRVRNWKGRCRESGPSVHA